MIMVERARRVEGHGGECGAAWQAWGVVLGIGVGLVEVSRLGEALRRTPALAAACSPRANAAVHQRHASLTHEAGSAWRSWWPRREGSGGGVKAGAGR
jgi:hypothetical protein